MNKYAPEKGSYFKRLNADVLILHTYLGFGPGTGIGLEESSTGMINPEIFAMYPETIEMGVVPAKGKLDGTTKISDRLIGAKQEPSPGHWTDTAQAGVESIDFGNQHHGRTLSNTTR